jgi:hypothetical protein
MRNTFKGIDEGFNNIKPWLTKKLKERRMSVDRFCVATKFVVNPTSIRRWYNDTCRPYPEHMKIVCETLSRLPVFRKDGSQYFETVTWKEGLSKYKAKPRAWLAHYVKNPNPDCRR